MAYQTVALGQDLGREFSMTVGADEASTSRAAEPALGSRDPKNQPWIEKYRPKTLDDVAANKEIIDTIKRLTDENRLPHLLLYGPPGNALSSILRQPVF